MIRLIADIKSFYIAQNVFKKPIVSFMHFIKCFTSGEYPKKFMVSKAGALTLAS